MVLNMCASYHLYLLGSIYIFLEILYIVIVYFDDLRNHVYFVHMFFFVTHLKLSVMAWGAGAFLKSG